MAFGMTLPVSWYAMFVAGGVCTSIRYCAGIRMNMVQQILGWSNL